MGVDHGGGCQPWADLLDNWRDWLRSSGRPDTTIRTRTGHIARLASGVSTPCACEVTLQDLVSWTGGQRWQLATRRSYRSSIATFFRWAEMIGAIDSNPALNLPKVPRPHPKPKPVPDNAYRNAILSSGDRMELILRLAAEAGLRCAEVANVHTQDVVEDLDGWSLRVRGKGGKERVVPLVHWIALRIREAPEGWLFPGKDHGHLSPRWVGRMVAEHLPGPWTMHALRHRFATRTYAFDRDLLTVQTLLGHSSPETTRNYVQLPDGAARRSIQAAADWRAITPKA